MDLKFYNENERLVSTFTEFICWTEVALTPFTFAGVPFPGINATLSAAGMGTAKGLVVSGLAQKVTPFGLATDPAAQAAAASDTTGPVTLLGIVDTWEFGPVLPGPPFVPDGVARAYSYSLYNDSVPVRTIFFPAN